MARVEKLGEVWTMEGGVLVKGAPDRPEILGGHWISLRDAQRIFDRPRNAIELAIHRKLIRCARRKSAPRYPSIFVLYEDVATWSARTPYHGSQKSYAAEPIFGLVKDIDAVAGGVRDDES